ncbi:unnamed protein product [Sphenostylis stenocarpa]|uniref:Uncharacterized protein n=1 Tax=Sphenostylis stenocarpa TaxID=92480 RepID=A0AA86T0C5_9FABA|nr:unnamed protein product [Sphenostylis stenocarpa]
MALFGFTYRSATVSTYNTSSNVRSETGGFGAKPFAPFVPKLNRGDGYSDEKVGNKKIVPVGRRPYDYESDDDEWKHGARASNSPRKLDPPNSTPVTSSPHWAHSSHPKPYIQNYDHLDAPRKPSWGAINHAGYTSPVIKDNYDHGYGYKPKSTVTPVYNDGYGVDYGDYNNKEGYKPKPKPMPKPTVSPVYNDGYGPDYGDYNNKEGYKPRPSSTPFYNDGYGAGDYNNKERYKPKPTSAPVYNGGDYGDYNNKEGYKPKPTFAPVYNGGDYGDYNKKEGYKPKLTGTSPVHNNGHNDDYGSYNNKERSKPEPTDSPVYDHGYGSDYNKEGPKPKSSEIPVYNSGYGIGDGSPAGGDNDYGGYPNNKQGGPKTSPGWSEKPRKGTPLSKPMNDIDEAMEMLKTQAAMRNGVPKAHENKPYYDGPGPTSPNEKSMNLVNESEKLKKIVTSAPQTPTKATFSLSSQRPRFNFNDGKRRDYGVMDHKEAERKFNGMTIS